MSPVINLKDDFPTHVAVPFNPGGANGSVQ
jgi:hypothetical protein